MQPRPIPETLGPWAPSLRVIILSAPVFAVGPSCPRVGPSSTPPPAGKRGGDDDGAERCGAILTRRAWDSAAASSLGLAAPAAPAAAAAAAAAARPWARVRRRRRHAFELGEIAYVPRAAVVCVDAPLPVGH